MPHADDGVDVSGHVLGVADGGDQVGVGAAAGEGLFGLVIVPIVDAVVMRAGMVGVARQDFADDQLGAVSRVAHVDEGQEGAGLHVVRVLDAQGLELLHLAAAELLVVGLGGGIAHGIGLGGFEGFDVEALALGDLVFTLDGLAQEVGGAVAFGGAGESPVSHGVVGLQLQAPAEGALGLVKI